MDLMVNFERKLAREKLLEAQLSAAVILIEKQEDTVVNLQFEVNQLKKILFKGKGERFVPFSLQLSLAFDDQKVITVPEPTKEKISYHRAKKKHPGRNALPEHIPVKEIGLEPYCGKAI